MKTPERNYFSDIKIEADLYLPLRELLKEIYKTDDIEITDKLREEKHGCDIIVRIQDLVRIGFQIKTTSFTKTTLYKEFRNNARNAAEFTFGVGHPDKLSQFIWVTTKDVTSTIPRSEIEDVKRSLGFYRKAEIWDGKHLYELFLKHYPQAFTNIKIDALTLEADKQSEKGNHIFAAHYLFRVFVLRLLRGDIASAREVINIASSELDMQTNRSIYFYRTLKRFYEIWRSVVEMNSLDLLIEKYKRRFISDYEKEGDEYEKTWHECIFLMQLVNDGKVKRRVESSGIESALLDHEFFCDFQYIFSQLQILFHEYANAPAGLSSRQICRTLLRFGFPPTGTIATRIDRTKKELCYERNRSVDGECSLCTATVLSSLVLANEDEKIIRPVKRWLENLDHCRYSHLKRNTHRDAANSEHALHYAAGVLEAFLDCGDSENAGRVLRHFFVSRKVGTDGFYIEWMKHRNISNLEICSYIFPAFHRCLISCKDSFQFNEHQLRFLRRAIVNLVNVLHAETPFSKPSRLYATRESVPAFCLGLLVGEKESTIELLRELIQNLHQRAIRIRKDQSFGHPSKRSLMDSNVDLNTRFIEGWVSYWETIFYLANDASQFGTDGAKLKRTVKELRDEGYLPS